MEVDSDDYSELSMDLDEEYDIDNAYTFPYFHYNLSQTFDDDYLNEEIRSPYIGSITLPKLRQSDYDDGYSADVEETAESRQACYFSRPPSVQYLGKEDIPVIEESDTFRSSGQIQDAANSTSGIEVSVRSTHSSPLVSPQPIPTASGIEEQPIPTPSILHGGASSFLDEPALASSVPTSGPRPSPCLPDALDEDPSLPTSEPQASPLHEECELASALPPDSEDESLVEQILLEGISDSPDPPSVSLPNLSADRIQPPSTVSEALSQAPKCNSRRNRRRRILCSHLKIKGRPSARVLTRCTVSRLAQEIAHLVVPISGAIAISEDLAGRASLSRTASILRSLRRRLTLVQNCW